MRTAEQRGVPADRLYRDHVEMADGESVSV